MLYFFLHRAFIQQLHKLPLMTFVQYMSIGCETLHYLSWSIHNAKMCRLANERYAINERKKESKQESSRVESRASIQSMMWHEKWINRKTRMSDKIGKQHHMCINRAIYAPACMWTAECCDFSMHTTILSSRPYWFYQYENVAGVQWPERICRKILPHWFSRKWNEDNAQHRIRRRQNLISFLFIFRRQIYFRSR